MKNDLDYKLTGSQSNYLQSSVMLSSLLHVSRVASQTHMMAIFVWSFLPPSVVKSVLSTPTPGHHCEVSPLAHFRLTSKAWKLNSLLKK